MPESFGTRLRHRREQQHVALAAIAAQTKIKPSLLEALERDDVSLWPTGIFRRAYLRSYAQAIGVDPDATVREFLEIYPDPSETVEPVSAVAAAGLADMNGGPPTRLRNIVGSTIGSLPWFKPVAKETRQPLARNGHADETDLLLVNGKTTKPEPLAPIELTSAPRDPVPASAAPSATPSPTPASAAAPRLMDGTALVAAPPAVAMPREPDIVAAASLCTAFCRVDDVSQMPRLLKEAARILDAAGIVVWIWDGKEDALKPALAVGYPGAVVAQLPVVHRDANNATAAAFRSAEARTVAGSDRGHGALVIPIVKANGCMGVLAIELRNGSERAETTRAVAAIIAAQLAHALAPQPMFDAHASDSAEQPVHAGRTT